MAQGLLSRTLRDRYRCLSAPCTPQKTISEGRKSAEDAFIAPSSQSRDRDHPQAPAQPLPPSLMWIPRVHRHDTTRGTWFALSPELQACPRHDVARGPRTTPTDRNARRLRSSRPISVRHMTRARGGAAVGGRSEKWVRFVMRRRTRGGHSQGFKVSPRTPRR